MLFNSFAYMFFLPIVFGAYWCVNNKYRWIILVVASYFFYMCSGPRYALIILAVTITSFFSALKIENAGGNREKKAILGISVFACMGALFFFKYFNFFSRSASSVFMMLGIEHEPITLNVILPVGISFYTFQTMSYVIDVYRGTTKAEAHIGKYAAFVSFFPQLVAGPIERSSNLLPQIHKNHIFNYEQAMYGVKIMLWGYYKKLVIADVLSTYVQKVFDAPQGHAGFSLILASVFFTLQIYCDFSGYSDIAIGTAKLFNIDLMTNFRSPYFADSIHDFWSRWHISLSTWFRDYVYIPLGGNRVGSIRRQVNLLITFLVSGLWHGANWTFVIWGGVHGCAQIIENILFGRKKERGRGLGRAMRIAVVFVFCVFAWVFFVSNTIDDAVYVLCHCLDGIGQPINYFRSGFVGIGMGVGMLCVITISVLVMVIYDYISYNKDYIHWISQKGLIFQWGFYIIIGLMIVFLSKKGVAAEFIYFQF